MPLALRALLYRERRRLGLVATLAYVAGFLFYLPAPFYLGPVHIAFVTGAIYSVVVATAAIVICALLPSMRYMIEAVAIARVMLAFLVALVPQVGFQIIGNPFLTALLVVSGGAAVSRMIHGRREKVRFGPRPWHRRAVWHQATDRQQRFVAWVDGSAPAVA
jgi:hypothetical protein